MSFKHRVIKEEDDDRFLNCDEVESLDDLNFVADQLRADSAHLESRFPATSDGSGVFARPICAEVTDEIPKSHVERQMELCLTQVEVVLNKKQKRQNNLRSLMRGLVASVSLAVIMTTAFFSYRALDPHELQDDSAKADLSTAATSASFPANVVSSVTTDPTFGLTSAKQVQIDELKLTPVSLEMPPEFLDASGPEMEGLLDLYESDSAAAVMIEF